MKNSAKSVKILLVDDEEELRMMLADYLESIGHEVFHADNGKSALEIFEKQEIDIVITDVRMPVMSGIDLLKSVKSISPSTPVITMSGYLPTPNQEQTIKNKSEAYLKKPFTLRHLQETITNLFDGVN